MSRAFGPTDLAERTKRIDIKEAVLLRSVLTLSSSSPLTSDPSTSSPVRWHCLRLSNDGFHFYTEKLSACPPSQEKQRNDGGAVPPQRCVQLQGNFSGSRVHRLILSAHRICAKDCGAFALRLCSAMRAAACACINTLSAWFIQLALCPAFLTHIGPTAHGRRQPGV